MRQLALVVMFFLAIPSAQAIDIFGKGSISKSYLSADKNTISISLAGGFALSIFSWVRLEARYTNISTLQNKLDIETPTISGTLTDIKTQTGIYSVGLDFDFLGEKYPIQPFIYLGVGYIESDRSYYFTDNTSGQSDYFSDPKQVGISANGGAGFRIKIAKRFALELEIYAYAIDIQKPNPLPNLYGTAGIRFFI